MLSCSLEPLAFADNEFDLVYVVATLATNGRTLTSCRHIKRIARGVPEDKVRPGVA